jgi:hypothetical protein
MPRGRVRVLDEVKQREVCALVSAGCSLQAAAQYVGCAPNTIRREANRDPEFARRFREARLQAQLSPLQAMRKAANSHWRAAAWMLERGDPEHFARRPAPAFRPKQAQALRNDIVAILTTEIENPIVLQRVRRQIQHLMRYAIDGVVGVERTDRQLRAVLREVDKLQFEEDQRDAAAYDRAFGPPLAGPPPHTDPPTETTPPDRKNADPPLTAQVMDRLIEQLRGSSKNGSTDKKARGHHP